jgi:hypothetical protein
MPLKIQLAKLPRTLFLHHHHVKLHTHKCMLNLHPRDTVNLLQVSRCKNIYTGINFTNKKESLEVSQVVFLMAFDQTCLL